MLTLRKTRWPNWTLFLCCLQKLFKWCNECIQVGRDYFQQKQNNFGFPSSFLFLFSHLSWNFIARPCNNKPNRLLHLLCCNIQHYHINSVWFCCF
jgi:hypothetical protein